MDFVLYSQYTVTSGSLSILGGLDTHLFGRWCVGFAVLSRSLWFGCWLFGLRQKLQF